jgi:N-methylhydantoinase B
MTDQESRPADIDAVELEILRNQLEAVAEEMGEVLIRGAYSPNITERRDCSTALFDAEGRMVAQAEHIPVHLGAMPGAVAAVRERDPAPGETYVLNDPFCGGTHLPDITLVSTLSRGEEILGYAVSRAHHADVGGMAPGSMPAGARDIHQEGLRIPPVRLETGGDIDDSVESLVLANVRNPTERRADLRAQLGANERARSRIDDLLDDHGDRLLAAFDSVIDYSRQRLEAELAALPDGTYTARDVMEGDGLTETDIPIEVTVTIDGATVGVDFTGTAEQVPGNVNAPLAVAKSAVYFVVRSVTDPDIPPNHGCYEPVEVHAPEGCLVNPTAPAAVVGGNVETSQRIADVVFGAFAEAAPERVPAQGQGTMNNLIIGSSEFTYYETIGGGAGGTPDSDGLSAVQVGMTNTQNTPIEALETEYPLHVEEYAIRRESGGDGQFRGGDGIVRSVTLAADATVSLLTERRRHPPHGVAGGGDGATGRNLIDGEEVPAKVTRELDAGTTVRLETPGGGGYGDDEPDTEG